LSEIPRQTSESVGARHPGGINTGNEAISATVNLSMLQDPRYSSVDGSFNDAFNYASFMWDHDLQNSMMQPTRWRELGFSDIDVFAQRPGMVSWILLLSSVSTHFKLGE